MEETKHQFKFIKVSNFDFLNYFPYDFVFVDIEGTVLTPNIFCELLMDKEFFRLFLSNIEINNTIEYKISDIIYSGKNFIRHLTDIDIPSIFRIAQRKRKKLIALSSGFRSTSKIIQLRQLGIYFNYLLFTQRADKGIFLLDFLRKNPNLYKNKKICVIDNHEYKLKSISNIINPEEFDIQEFHLILYENHYVHDVTINSFKQYWRNVVKNMDINRKKYNR